MQLPLPLWQGQLVSRSETSGSGALSSGAFHTLKTDKIHILNPWHGANGGTQVQVRCRLLFLVPVTSLAFKTIFRLLGQKGFQFGDISLRGVKTYPDTINMYVKSQSWVKDDTIIFNLGDEDEALNDCLSTSVLPPFSYKTFSSKCSLPGDSQGEI